MLNIHPSLLPRHRGLRTHQRALEAGDAVHGASVHFVTPELDGGPVVLQARVPVRADDDEATLAARVLAQEHRIYPQCIGWFAAGRLQFRDGAAVLDGRALESPLVVEASDEVAA
jgi:phosphoribosylglycinamide formyltransferase-1